jgi:hypothetical protein
MWIVLGAAAPAFAQSIDTWNPTDIHVQWSLGSNWTLGHPPGASDTAVFDGATSQVTCAINVPATAASVETINGYTGTILNEATLTTQTFLLSSGTYLANGNVFLPTALDVEGSVTIASSAHVSMNATDVLNVGGTFSGGGATFGIVNLTGTNQVVFGNNTFAQLTKTVSSADTLQLAAGSTQVITGPLTLRGASAAARLALRSSVNGSTWSIDARGSTRNLADLDVKDSTNLNAAPMNLVGTGSVDSGNNHGWIFDVAVPALASWGPWVLAAALLALALQGLRGARHGRPVAALQTPAK